MNVLIVDDQISVINGLMRSIDFKKLGYDHAFGATDADEALEIMARENIQVLISDIEMPGKSGLDLNAIVRERYPETLRILLTSHASFSYAQEGLKLGCFDYLVQPVAYAQVEETLAKAAVQVRVNEKHTQMNKLGNLLDTHRTEFLNATMMGLFGADRESRDRSLSLLREAGYDIGGDAYVKLLLVDLVHFEPVWLDQAFLTDAIMTIKMVLRSMELDSSIGYVIGRNRYNQFAVLFFAPHEFRLSTTTLETLYARMERNLDSEIACYVGWTTTIPEIRESVLRVHGSLKNNISRKPGLVYVHREADPEWIPTSLDEFVKRWESMLRAGQSGLLRSDIFQYLDRNLSVSSSGFNDLITLHQRITQMFFNYFYEKKLDIISLFNEDMSYEEFMRSCNNIDTMKRAVEFLISAIDRQGNGGNIGNEAGYVERAKTYILENNDKLLTVKDVSNYIGLNAEYFTRLFKKEMGLNIKEYIIECKLTTAKELLEKSNLPISMVALELGYSNFSHFTQMFKRAEGMTPKEYRAMKSQKG